MTKLRQYCLWIHRYTGLIIAAFLILAGLTGSLLAFHEDIDDAINHRLTSVTVKESTLLPIATLHDNVVQTYPQYSFSSLPVAIEADKSVLFLVDRSRDKSQVTPLFQEVYVNPYSGEIIGTRDKDTWQWQNVMWKVFWLHRELLLGHIGKLVLGVVALIWTLNCFIGFYLTLPRPTKKSPNLTKKRASMLKRWLPAWKIRTKTNTFKLNYDLHQAFGLWLWLLFFVIAWSSVGFNLKQVYQPVMKAAIGLEVNGKDKKADKAKQAAQKQSPSEQALLKAMPNDGAAYTVTKANSIDFLSQQAVIASKNYGVNFQKPLGMRWDSEEQAWQLRFKTDKDAGQKGGASSITVDAKSGAVIRTHFGDESTAAQKTDQWLSALHMGHIGDGVGKLLYQIFLAITGVALAIASVTGVYLWLKGRKSRKLAKKKAPITPPYPQSPVALRAAKR